ncbi:mucin-2-like [Glossina fuscipes]|uniref:Mucin-2-like n=1 Tax=Glossina fuscipes TaxID=7396 RepID=A0A8U0W8D5_9MUSC|nr:mucin-2-like [Glossina fuscipes]
MKALNLLPLLFGLIQLISSASVPHKPNCSLEQNDSYIADPISCSHFYKCSNGQPYRQRCAPGLYFDESAKICNHISLVNCSKQHGQHRNVAVSANTDDCGSKPQSTTTCHPPITTTPCDNEETTTCCCDDDTTTLVTTTCCCDDSTLEPSTTAYTLPPTSTNTAYTTTSAPTTTTQLATTTTSPTVTTTIIYTSTSPTTSPDSTSTDSHTSPTTTIFPSTTTCKPSTTTKPCETTTTTKPCKPSTTKKPCTCKKRKIASVTSSNTQTSKLQTKLIPTSSIPTETRINGPDPRTVKPVILDLRCGKESNGSYIRDEKDCAKYYVCRNGKPIEHRCERGMWFDNEKLVCNYKNFVKNCKMLTY